MAMGRKVLDYGASAARGVGIANGKNSLSEDAMDIAAGAMQRPVPGFTRECVEVVHKPAQQLDYQYLAASLPPPLTLYGLRSLQGCIADP